MRRMKSSGPLGMELTRQFIQEKCDSMRLMREGRGLNDPGELRNLAHQRQFGRVVQTTEVSPGQETGTGSRISRHVNHLAGVAEDRLAAGMPVLHVEHRVVA